MTALEKSEFKVGDEVLTEGRSGGLWEVIDYSDEAWKAKRYPIEYNKSYIPVQLISGYAGMRKGFVNGFHVIQLKLSRLSLSVDCPDCGQSMRLVDDYLCETCREGL